jgi:hypothetical protein
MSQEKYRILKHGEIIQEGDEVDACVNPWRDDPKWEQAANIGQSAPDPKYPSHSVYRRKIDTVPILGATE